MPYISFDLDLEEEGKEKDEQYNTTSIVSWIAAARDGLEKKGTLLYCRQQTTQKKTKQKRLSYIIAHVPFVCKNCCY